MDNIKNFMSHNSKYNALRKPLEAARICEAARMAARGRYDVVSFKLGLLTLGVSSSSQAANIQAESTQIIEEINKKLGQNIIERIRTKLV
jgi:hypothetical protein